MEHGMAVDVILNPTDPTSGYTLDRWGGIHAFGSAVAVQTTSFWPGQDVARRVVVSDWATAAGYVMDLDGGAAPTVRHRPTAPGRGSTAYPVKRDDR